ncbi:hypothetical protein [Ruegeria lacuscaerulensis]|nr:hypothetical protein [Ruegeria lacuscaerulensis]
MAAGIIAVLIQNTSVDLAAALSIAMIVANAYRGTNDVEAT